MKETSGVVFGCGAAESPANFLVQFSSKDETKSSDRVRVCCRRKCETPGFVQSASGVCQVGVSQHEKLKT